MDASFNSGSKHSSDASADRLSRKRAIAVAPRVDGLEERQLLSHVAGPRQIRLMQRRAAVVQKARLRAARMIVPANTAPVVATPATITSDRYTTPAIPTVGSNSSPNISLNPIMRLLGNGTIGLKITKPNIPGHIVPSAPQAPAPAPVVVAQPTTPAAPTVPADAPAAGATQPADSTTPEGPVASTPVTPSPEDIAVQNAMDKLGTDTQAINDKSQVTPAMLAALRNDYQAIEKAATNAADAAKIAALQNDFKAVGDTLPTQLQMAQIKLDVAALVGSRGVTDSDLIEKTLTHAEAILTASNITADDLKTLVADSAAVSSAIAAQMKTMPAPAMVTNLSDLIASSAPAGYPMIPTEMPKAMEGILTGLFGPLLGYTLPQGPMPGSGSLVGFPGPMGGMPFMISQVTMPIAPADGDMPIIDGQKIDMKTVMPVLV